MEKKSNIWFWNVIYLIVFLLWDHLSSKWMHFFFFFLLLACSGCLAGNLQQGRQVPWTHNTPTSQTLDASQLPVLGHLAAFTSHQFCLWRGCQWFPPPHHWLYHLPHHRLVNCAPLALRIAVDKSLSHFVLACIMSDPITGGRLWISQSTLGIKMYP